MAVLVEDILCIYCELSPSKTTVFIQSSLFNDNVYEFVRVFMWNGKNRVGSKQRGRERKREQRINGVSEGVLDRNGNGVGWKWLLVKRDT
jgi:hypothetical protein